MPELPEVETVLRGLAPHLVGRRIRKVDAFVSELRWPVDLQGLREFCIGKTITHLRRRAKFIIVELDNQTGLLLHLGMSGAFRIEPEGLPFRKYDRIAWLLDDGHSWRFSDIRRFGSVVMCRPLAPDADPPQLGHFGPEPLSGEFNGDSLYTLTRGRSRPVKSLIMDQEIVVGVGNIYANEALFRAGINPRRQSRRLGRESCKRLVTHIKEVLSEAIEVGGTTVSTYRGVNGTEGKFHIHLDVYGKAGEACPRCGEEHRLRRSVVGGRSTFHCPACQH